MRATKGRHKLKHNRNDTLKLLLSSFVIFHNSLSSVIAFTGKAPFLLPISHCANIRSHEHHHPIPSSPCNIPPTTSILKTAASTRLYMSQNPEDEEEEKIGFLDFINPFRAPTAIPAEYREEIMRAEANTQAAKDRSTRIGLYVLLALSGVAIAGFNGFLTNVRLDLVEKYGETWTLEQDQTFGWTVSNPVFGFLLTNGLGGAVAFLTGGLSLVLAEMEVRTGKENAVKIWREIKRRKEEASGGTVKKEKKRAKKQKKKKRSGKETKRLAALSEVMMEEKEEPKKVEVEMPVEKQDAKVEEKQQQPTGEEEEGGGGLIGKMKDLYKKADDMAAAQALLLNKELEERGVVDKITDESGLKVIGKEAAAKLEEEKKKPSNEDGVEKK